MPPATVPDDSPAATVATGGGRFGPSRRLRRPAEFAAVLAAPRAQSLRAARHWLSMTAAWSASETPAVRFGITVGKRNARRAVDRAVVKRILREASRHAASALDVICASRGLRLDVAFRLKASRDRPAEGQPALVAWRQALRAEADFLLDRLGQHLTAREA